MKFSGETLMAYADGELDAHTCREIEAAMPSDPHVAEQIARHRSLQTSLRATFAPVLHDAVPQRLLDAARRPSGAANEMRPDTSATRPLLALSWPVVAMIGALLLVGLLVGRALSPSPTQSVTTLDGRMLADGALAAALSEQPGGTETLPSGILVGLSYLAKDGGYCRTFTLKQGESIAGVACREADSWHIQALAQTGPKSPLAQYRMAGTLVPPLILGTVEGTIDGSPLDAEAEAAARKQGWQR